MFLADIVAEAESDQGLVFPIYGACHLRLTEAVDRINHKHGLHAVRTLAMGNDLPWEMWRGRLSGRYTTRPYEVLKVNAS